MLKNRELSPRNSWSKSECYSWCSVTLANAKTSFSLCSRKDLSLWLVLLIYTMINLKNCIWEISSIGKDVGSLNTMGMMTVLTSGRPKKNRKETTTMAVVMIKTIKNKMNHMRRKKVSMSSSRLS